MSTLESHSVGDICDKVKHLGYTVSGRVRLYGEEYEVVSDPFPEADGIAVQAKTKNNPTVRKVRLPATVIQGLKGRKSK